MKKTLVALAALAATASFAQSSVTISGRMDLGHASVKTAVTSPNGLGGRVTATAKVYSLAGEQNGRTTSRLTFAGTEDLGGGLRANFNYETRLNPDNIASAGLDRTRNMFLNVSGGFGGITIGTYSNSVDVLRGYSAATYSVPGGDFLSNHGGMSGRSTNSIAYRSPSLGGFVIAAGVTSEKATADAAGVVVTEGKVNGSSIAASYNNGPLSAHAVSTSAKATTISPAKAAVLGNDALGIPGSPAVGPINNTGKVSTNGFAVSYDLGMAKPYFQYENGKTTPSTAVNANSKYSAWEIGATFPLGAFTPYVTFGNGKLVDRAAGVVVSSDKTSAYQFGTTYALSKRTSLYGAYGAFNVKENTPGVLNVNRVNLKSTGYKFGLIHNF